MEKLITPMTTFVILGGGTLTTVEKKS